MSIIARIKAWGLLLLGGGQALIGDVFKQYERAVAQLERGMELCRQEIGRSNAKIVKAEEEYHLTRKIELDRQNILSREITRATLLKSKIEEMV